MLVRRREVFERAEVKLSEQRLNRDEAVREAYAKGVGATEIAALTGISRPYVYMLVHRDDATTDPAA
jgi:hypothetical protein